MTPLDTAYAAMEAGGDQERLAFYGMIAQAELFLALTEEPVGEAIKPWIFDTGQGKFAIAFDTEERLSEFGNGPTAFVALSGRTVIEMLEGQGVGLGVNLVVAPSGTLLEPSDITWIASVLDSRPVTAEAWPEELRPPVGLPDHLILALDQRLSVLEGQARYAYLAEVAYDNGTQSHVIAFVNTSEGAEDALVQTISEALAFSGVEAANLDVMFIKSSDAIAAQFATAGLRFDLHQPQTDVSPDGEVPGSNPDKPPILH
ncbi:MAG: SseB family protein [Pseudomonadota bacterium]